MAHFNLPPGVTLQDLEPTKQPSTEDFFDRLDRAYDQHVNHCLAEGRDWRKSAAAQQQFNPPSAPVRACTYPARPVNGGSLRRALPKVGQWHYEPKYNGWRALVHAPTRTMFNRYGERLTIQREFSTALALLSKVRMDTGGLIEWFDCEALERRHGLGRGTLLVFDYISMGSPEPYHRRRVKLIVALPVHNCTAPPASDQIYAVPAPAQNMERATELYLHLQQLNRQWRCPFYEGLVAKRTDSIYPVQLRSPTLEFPGWVKHRWAR